ncbi:hypothetical protein ACQ4PT_000489 [Festuca glaucescens]
MEIRDAEALSLDVMLRALDVVALLKVEAAPVAVLLIVVVVSALVSGTSRQGSPAALQEPEITIFAVAISEISIEALASTAMIEGTTVEAPKPTVVMYGYANEGLMFCECPTTGTFRPKIDNAKMAKVTVTGDVLTIPEIIEQLKRIVPSENFHWEVQHYHNNVFKVKFPNKSEVQRARNFLGSGKSFAVNVPSANCEEDLALGLPSGVLSASGSPTLASVAAAVGHAAVQSPTAGSVVADEARTGRGEDTRLAGSLQGEGGKKSTCHVLRTTWGSPMGAQCVRASDCSGIADGRGSPGGSSAGHVSGQGSSTPKINAGIAEWADGFASFFEFARQCS